jgi:hypothetical protein
MNAAARTGRRPGLERWAGLGAVAYVVLFAVGAILGFGDQPNTNSPPEEVIAYYRDAGNRDKINLGWLLVILGVFFLLWFLSALRQLLRRIDPDGFLGTLAVLGGVLYGTATLVGISVNAAIKTMSDDTFRHQVYPSLIHAADDAGFVIHAGGGIGAGAMMIAASLAAVRAALIPNWLGWLGIVSGILALFSIFFVPQFLIAIWLLIAGVLVFRATGEAPTPRAR